MDDTRRNLLRLLAAGVVSVTAGARAAPVARILHGGGEDALRDFPEGVASADPEPGSVILWTRVRPPEEGGEVRLAVQLSEQPDFSTVIAEQMIEASAALDHTIRAAIHRLQPSSYYYYRFVTASGAASPIGRTRTAPDPDMPQPFRFATASCQNYQTGYYHAYRTLIERERSGEAPLDFVLFLGDFIYEMIFRGGVRPLTLPGRAWETSDGISGTELSYQYAESVDDYRYLYRSYLADPWLRAARARWPFLCIWDDHEFTNDAWQSMATYTDVGEPSQRRRVAASQAWFEYIPARLTGPLAHDFRATTVEDVDFGHGTGIDPADELNNRAAIDAIALPRKLRWGGLADIILTDSRSYRSEPAVPAETAKQLSLHARALLPRNVIESFDAGRTANGGDPAATIEHQGHSLINTRMDAEPGSMLGSRQFRWLTDSLSGSPAAWKLCASSVPVLPLGLDFRYDIESGETVDDEVVFTIDSWEGYPTERKALLDHIAADDISGVVFLSGDHHMHMAGTLKTDRQMDSESIASEFCVGGVSSTSLGDVLRGFVQGRMQGSLAARLIGGPDDEPGPRWMNFSFIYGREASERLLRDHATGRSLDLDHLQKWQEHLRFVDVQSYGVATVLVESKNLTVTYDAYEANQIAQSYESPQRPVYRATLNVIRNAAEARLFSEPTFEGRIPFPYASQ
ncbi:MAG: alkaline phosphatase D family protein [Parasphingopyxis sp.]|uniref:alkaline phosphatase D family protein n=1 Tax=Parasphingopyxis sp. TaxID=1920299 RepID=UPI003FA002F8